MGEAVISFNDLVDNSDGCTVDEVFGISDTIDINLPSDSTITLGQALPLTTNLSETSIDEYPINCL